MRTLARPDAFLRILRACLAALPCLGITAMAEARSRPSAAQEVEQVPRLLVLRFAGKQGSAARAKVLAALEDENGVDVLPLRAFEARSDAHDGTPRAYADAARELGVDAFITGKLTRSGTKLTLRVTLIDGKSGRVSGNAVFEGAESEGNEPQAATRAVVEAHVVLEPAEGRNRERTGRCRALRERRASHARGRRARGPDAQTRSA
ncbi:MAG: hypothetical protein QM756_34140 [Polyangiaceae bacterium]